MIMKSCLFFVEETKQSCFQDVNLKEKKIIWGIKKVNFSGVFKTRFWDTLYVYIMTCIYNESLIRLLNPAHFLGCMKYRIR